MKVTAVSVQQKNPDRVNISIDGKYRFSLDVLQVTELGIKVGKDYNEDELAELLSESEFGKLYFRALEYIMSRPHSEKEVRDYLWRKTRTTKVKNRTTGEVKDRPGVSQQNAGRVLERLKQKGHVDDEAFAHYWVENRSLRKGTSLRKLQLELRQKGVDQALISQALEQSTRSDKDELQKIITKKRHRYPDEQKLIVYLMRQGFSYHSIREALSDD